MKGQNQNKKNDSEIVAYFMRHLVPVAFTFTKGQETHNFIITSFVLSVVDQWFLVTAGHCLKSVDEFTKKRHYNISNCVLIDSLGLGAKHTESIPFYYEGSNPTHVNEDDNFDYGVMVLSPLYRKQLERNKIEPLNEKVWDLQPSPSDVDFYALLGLPSELTKIHSGILEVTPFLHRINPLNKRPDEFPETKLSLFYGSIVLGNEVTSIKGMSGGPIFAFRQEETGQLRYWLIALQSTWLTQKNYICGYPTKILGRALETML